MRPLAIWAMQWALTQPRVSKQNMKPEIEEDSVIKQHAGFSRVASVLKVAKEEDSRNFIERVYNYTCKRLRI